MKIRGKTVRRLYVERQKQEPASHLVTKQLIGFFCLIPGFILSIPGVPGPGILFFALALLLLEYPGKRTLFLYLKKKRGFRIIRVLLWRKMGMFLVL